MTALEQKPLSWADLEARWQPIGETPEERQRHLQRLARAWGLRAMLGTRGSTARFHAMDVVDAEARAAGRRGV